MAFAMRTVKLPPTDMLLYVSVFYDKVYKAGQVYTGCEYASVNLFLKPMNRVFHASGYSVRGHYYEYCHDCTHLHMGYCEGGTQIAMQNTCKVINYSDLQNQVRPIEKTTEPSLFQHPVIGESPRWWMIRDKADGNGIEGIPYHLGNVYEDGTFCTGNVRRRPNDAFGYMNDLLSARWNNDVATHPQYRNNVYDWISKHSLEFQLEKAYKKYSDFTDFTYLTIPNSVVIKNPDQQRPVIGRVYITNHLFQEEISHVVLLDLSSSLSDSSRERIYADFPFLVPPEGVDTNPRNTHAYIRNSILVGYYSQKTENVYFNNDEIKLTKKELEDKGYVFSV